MAAVLKTALNFEPNHSHRFIICRNIVFQRLQLLRGTRGRITLTLDNFERNLAKVCLLVLIPGPRRCLNMFRSLSPVSDLD